MSTDVKENFASVTPKSDKNPSPKEMWQAVIDAGYTPSKLEGPDGKFDKKPEK